MIACSLRIMAWTIATVSTTCMKTKVGVSNSSVARLLFVAGVGVGRATAAGRNVVKLAGIEGIHEHRDRPGRRNLLDVDQKVRRPDLAGGDDVLNLRDDDGNDGEGLGGACDLPEHADLQDLRLDLAETGHHDVARIGRNEESGGSQQSG